MVCLMHTAILSIDINVIYRQAKRVKVTNVNKYKPEPAID